MEQLFQMPGPFFFPAVWFMKTMECIIGLLCNKLYF